MKQKGFTLIELLVVVAIIGILAAVGVLAYNGYTASAKRNAVKANHATASKFIQSEVYKAESTGQVSQWDSINKICKQVNANSEWHTHGQWAFGCLTEDTSRTNPFDSSSIDFNQMDDINHIKRIWNYILPDSFFDVDRWIQVEKLV